MDCKTIIFALSVLLIFNRANGQRGDLNELLSLLQGNGSAGAAAGTPTTQDTQPHTQFAYNKGGVGDPEESDSSTTEATSTPRNELLCAFGRMFNSQCPEVGAERSHQSNNGPIIAGGALFAVPPPTQRPMTTRAPLDKYNSAYLPNSKKKCTPNPNTSKCMYYDGHVQAATLREAIVNFADLTNQNMRQAMPSRADRLGGKCVTDECRACTQLIVKWLVAQSNWLNQYEARQLLRTLDADRQVSASCKRITLPVVTSTNDNQNNTTAQYANMCLKTAERLMSPRSSAPSREELIAGLDRRGKRQAQATLIGERVIVKCVKRGYAADDSSKYVSLCSQCWTFRKLPPDYYPRYVNELVCTAGADQECFGGYGNCIDHPRPVQIQRTLQPSKVTVEENLSISACCDCRMPATSPLIPFIQN